MSIEDEITPPLAALAEELFKIRREMMKAEEAYQESVKRGWIKWDETQESVMRANLGKTDVQIAREVSKYGPKRSAKAVKTKRREYESTRVQSRVTHDWPKVGSDIVEQSERFRVRLLEEMLKEVRSARGG